MSWVLEDWWSEKRDAIAVAGKGRGHPAGGGGALGGRGEGASAEVLKSPGGSPLISQVPGGRGWQVNVQTWSLGFGQGCVTSCDGRAGHSESAAVRVSVRVHGAESVCLGTEDVKPA